MTGKKFGRWTVVKEGKRNKHNKRTWVCKCSCLEETIKTVSQNVLKSGESKSCGCLHKEIVRNKRLNYRKGNSYNLEGFYGIGYTSKSEEFYFDLEDYNKIKKYTWRKNTNGYIVAQNKGRQIRFHRLVINAPKGKVVDHINHILEDNRKENLRICTVQENAFNSIVPKDNSSGVKGVWWNKNKSGWDAEIRVNQEKIWLGRYDNFKNAVLVRFKAEKKYFGKHRYVGNDKRIIDIINNLE